MKNMMNLKLNKFINILKLLILCLFFLLNNGCRNINKTQEKDTDSLKTNLQDGNSSNILYSVPSALETAILLKNSGINFNISLLNPVENERKYITTEQKAVNLGIYSTDLCLTCMYNQSQKQINYFNIVDKITKDLGIHIDIDSKTYSELEKNSENIDFLHQFISTKLLKKISAENLVDKKIGAYIVFGVYLEGLYLLLKHNEETKSNNPLVLRTIYEQKPPIGNIIQLVKNSRDKEVDRILADLEQINQLLAAGEIQKSISKIETNHTQKSTTIKTKSSYNNGNIKTLTENINALRNKYIN